MSSIDVARDAARDVAGGATRETGFECPISYDSMTKDAAVTNCGHLFSQKSMNEYLSGQKITDLAQLNDKNVPCPLCKTRLITFKPAPIVCQMLEKIEALQAQVLTQEQKIQEQEKKLKGYDPLLSVVYVEEDRSKKIKGDHKTLRLFYEKDKDGEILRQFCCNTTKNMPKGHVHADIKPPNIIVSNPAPAPIQFIDEIDKISSRQIPVHTPASLAERVAGVFNRIFPRHASWRTASAVEEVD